MRNSRTPAVLALVALAGATLALAGSEPANTKDAKQRMKSAGKAWSHFTTLYDANNDNRVTKGEFMAKRPGFDRADANKDGAVTADEIKAKPAAQKRGKSGQKFVEHFDADKDGSVTSAEFDTGRARGFDRMDKNGDGAVTAEEFAAAAQAAGKRAGKNRAPEEAVAEELGD